MNCEKAMELLFGGLSGDAGLKAHLAKCRKCAAMARQWQSLQDAMPGARSSEPPIEIDVRIHSAALAKARGFKLRRLAFRIAIPLAAAAAVAVVATLGVAHMPGLLRGEPAYSGIAWDSVAMGDEIAKLSAEIEASSALLSKPSKEPSSQSQDVDGSLQAISLDVPDLLTGMRYDSVVTVPSP